MTQNKADTAIQAERCQAKGCNEDAVAIPRLCVPAQGWPIDAHQPLAMVIKLPLCQHHKAKAAAHEFVETEQQRAVFAYMAKGKIGPDYARAFFEWLPLTHPDYLMLKSASDARKAEGESHGNG